MPVIQQNTITVFINFNKDIIPIEGSLPTKEIVEFILELTRMDLNDFNLDNISKLHTKNYKDYSLSDYDFLLKGLKIDKLKVSENRFYKIHLNWNGKYVTYGIEKLYVYGEFIKRNVPVEFVENLLDLPVDLKSQKWKCDGNGEFGEY